MIVALRKKWLLRYLFFLILFFAPIIARCYIESFIALSRARSALGHSEYRQAAELYVKAIRWRAPLNIFASQAFEELRELIQSESKDDQAYALLELRRALFSSRSFYYSSDQNSPEVQEIDAQLKALGVRHENTVVKVSPYMVSYSGQLMVQVGFWGWLACSLLLIWRGFNSQGQKNIVALSSYGACGVLFFILWLYALAVA